jgi:hypothetical protein
MYDLLFTLDQVYSEYMTNIHKIRDEQVKWMLENRLGSNNSINSLSHKKISKFVDLSLEWRPEIKDKLVKVEEARTILSEVDMIFNSIINSIHNTPNLNNPSTLVDFL